MAIVERLFPGTTLQDFLSEYWLYRPISAVAPLSRFPEIANNPIFRDLSSAIGMKCRNYRVDVPDQTGEQLVPRQYEATFEQAQKALDSGHTVYMGGLFEEPLPGFAHELAAELDLPLFLDGYFLDRYWLAFAARPSKGLRWHWDRHHLLLLQVTGTKRFQIAKNQYFARPSVPPVGYDGWRKGMHPWLAGALGISEITAKDLPTQWDEIELSAGDALFMPAGLWHTAETVDDSLHIAYAIRVPTLPEFLIAQSDLMHEVFASQFHLPVASTRDLKSLCAGDDTSAEPLQVARRAWFSAMGRTMTHYAQGDHFAKFLQRAFDDAERGVFSDEAKAAR
jgi:cupin superfamily protein